MLKYFWVLCFAFLSFTVKGQDTIAEPNGPKIFFEKFQHDFGDVTEGDEVTYTFKFTNTGTDTLEIFNALSTCSCTAVERDTSKKYAPGETGEIIVGFKTKDKSGIQHKVITVFSNAVNTKSGLFRLFIRLNVIPPTNPSKKK